MSPNPPRQYRLIMRDLALAVRLGVGEDERAAPQEVRLSVRLDFHEAPPAAVSDALEETICYGEVAELLKSLIAAREFHLIEHLAHEALSALETHVRGRAKAGIAVLKVRPPVEGLLGGAEYACGEVLP